MHIGSRGATDQFFTGTIDEVKIYSSALTPEQIKIDYNTGSAVNYATGQDEAGNLADGSGNAPTGYWPMDENTGTSTTADKSGNGNDGTLISITGNAWVPGKEGSALKFDGSADSLISITGDAWVPGKEGSALKLDGSADYISTGPIFPYTNNFTVEAWINTSSLNIQQRQQTHIYHLGRQRLHPHHK